MRDNPISFNTILTRTGKNTTGIVVPPEVVRALGAGARPAVSVKVNDYEYRTTIGAMAGRSMLPFSAENRLRSGIEGDDPITVELALDTASREVDLPPDLEGALASRDLKEAFARIAPSRRKADILNVTGAKAPETRQRRIEAIVSRLSGAQG